ncbi:hypothetical protein [Catellatospora methionotrophica]|uniref:hypothetical protein n=1 Tax=Catellatospora methionotrophica TaxID=121620 RepID=UPI0014096A8B|nr:hypothetical protein [Catellatospora methionotrophica]
MVLTATMMILTTATVSPATAVPASQAYYTWLDCPAGTSNAVRIDDASTFVDYQGRAFASFGGQVFPCKSPQLDQDAWGMAAYRVDSAYGTPIPYKFDNLFSGHYTGAVRIRPGVRAVCVIADETTRLGCVSISWVDTDGVLLPVVGGPVPVDSPLVAAPAVTNMLMNPGPIGPGCVLCP